MPVIGVAKAGGTSISFAPARAKALKSTAASIARPSTSCAGCCVTWTATTTTPRHFRQFRKELGPARAAGILSRHPAGAVRTGRRRTWRVPIARTARASSWKSRSAPTLPRARDLNRILLGTFAEKRHLPHRPLPRKAARPQHVVFPVCQFFLEPSGIARHVESVQITMAEDFGVQGRGAFYDQTGSDPRRGPEPPVPNPEQPGDGAAGPNGQRIDSRRKGEGAQGHRAARREEHRARPIPRLPERERRCRRTHRRKLSPR